MLLTFILKRYKIKNQKGVVIMFNKKIIKLISVLTIATSIFQGKSCLANNTSSQENHVPRRVERVRRTIKLNYERARLDQTQDGIIEDYDRKAYILRKLLRSRALKNSEKRILREHPYNVCLFVHPSIRLENHNAFIHIWLPSNPDNPFSRGVARSVRVIYE